MNPVKQIGRYKLPILNVVAIKERKWRPWSFWISSGYEVLLTNGSSVHFNKEEKEAYEKALEEHELVMQVYGMCRGMGLRT